MNGIHYATGSAWGPAPDSCSREGFNPSGQPCDPTLTPPYAWLHDTTAASTTAGIVFSNELKGELEGELSNWLSTLGGLMGDSISTNISQCNALRNDINVRMSEDLPNINREDVFGVDDKYFKEGMHAEWAERPKDIVYQFTRFSPIAQLETKHQILFMCDERIAVRSAYDSLFTVYSQAPKKDELELYILEQAQTLSESQVGYVNSHPDTLKAWIQAQIYTFLKPKLTALGYVSNDIEFDLPNRINAKKPFFPSLDEVYKEFDRFASVASTKFSGLDELNEEDLLELARFEFAQGFQTVAGVDRVHFLAQLERQRHASMVSGNGDDSRLPLFLDQEIGSIRYTIILDNVSFDLTTLEATVDAYFVFYPPQDPTKMLVLQVVGLAFNPSGLLGPGRLVLQTPFEFKMFDPVKITLNPTDTYVDWDCNGFAGMNLDMGLDICRKYLTPTDLEGNDIVDTTAMVHSDFDIYVQSWNQILVDDLSITPFRPTNVDKAHFVLTGMSVDFSDFANPSNLVFPANYETPHLNAGTTTVSNQWRGVYIEAVSATLPREEFGSANSSEPLVIAGHNLIFDQSGVSGLFTASNVIPLSQGDVGGWAASVDEISIGLLANQLTEGSVAGKLHIPLFGGGEGSAITPDDCIDYYARACANGFMLEATAPVNGLEANVMLSQVTLDQNTSIVLIKQQGEAPLIQATLSGKLSIGGGDLPVEIEDLDFQGLRISNQRPYVEISAGQAWELPDVGIDFKGFGLNIENARILPSEEGIDLRFTTGLNLFSNQEEGSGSFAASGSFRTTGRFENDQNGRQRMYFSKFKLDTFCLDVKVNLNELSGKIVFFDETENPRSLWGKGFYGGIRLGIETKKGFKIAGAASAVFGSHNDGYKYFMVDAAAEFSKGIPIVPGLVINGFGGGVSRRMRKVAPAQYAGLVPPPGYWPSGPGESLSGALFEPDNTIGFGFAIAAAFTTESSESLMNMTARLEADFLAEGGIARLGLGGSAQIMEAVPPPGTMPIETDKEAVPPGGAMIKAIADINLDFEKEEFSGSLVSYVDMQQTIKGAGPSNRAGVIDVFFGSNNWHVKFGTPSQPMGVKFVVPGLDAGGLTVESYFMAGTNIDAPRGLPSNVTDLLGDVKQSSVFSSNLGLGVAFGTRFDAGFDTGDKIKPFMLKAELGAGFDVGLTYLGNEATCANRSSTSVGINGWYARGQLFAYFNGEIGLKAKIGSREREFKIGSLATAFMLQAELPNPLWAQGAVAVRYNLVGGIIKGDMDLQFEIGEQCVLIGNQSATADISIISSVVPVNGTTVARQDEVITVNFLVPLDEEFSLEDFNENSNIKYEASMDSLGLQDNNGRSILGDWKLDDEKQELVFTPYSMLPANDTLTFGIKASIKENGVVVETERRLITFATGDFAPVIPISNISGSYPYDGQRNFYRKQLGNNGGVNIQLHRGQPNIVENPPAGYELIMEMEYRASGTRAKTVYKSLSYDHALDIIHVPVKTGRLARGGGYKAKLLYRDKTRLSSSSASGTGASTPPVIASIVDGSLEATGPTATSFTGTTSDPSTSQGFHEANRLELSGGTAPTSSGSGATSAPAAGSNTLPDIDLYEMHFRVSEFNTFIEEVESKFDSVVVSLSRSSFDGVGGVKTYFLRTAKLNLPSDYLPDSRELGLADEALLRVDFSSSSLSGTMSEYMQQVNSFSNYDGRNFETTTGSVASCPEFVKSGGIYLGGGNSNELALGEGVDYSEVQWRNPSSNQGTSNISYHLGEISGPSKWMSNVYIGVHDVVRSINDIDDEDDNYICARCFNYGGPEIQACIDNPSNAQNLKDEIKASLLQGLPSWVKDLAAQALPSVPSSFSGDLILHYKVPVDGTPSSSVRVPAFFTAQ